MGGKLDVSLDLYQWMGILKHSTKTDILGANYSFAIIPAYGDTNINAFLSGITANGDKTKTGWQDLYVIPANLTWELSKYFDVSAQYSFWAPSGSYKEERNVNNGLGYWSHDFRLTGSYFPMGNPETLLSISGLYEVNTKKKGKDIHPGDRFILELGMSHIFNERFIGSLIGTANWEVTDTTGRQATDRGKDRVYGAGAEAIFFIVPEKWSLTARYIKEFDARDRTEGQIAYGFIGYQF